MIATVLTIKTVERYALGSRCRRSIRIARRFFCSTSWRNRTREIEVSDVSAEAAVAARINATTMMAISIQAVVSKAVPT